MESLALLRRKVSRRSRMLTGYEGSLRDDALATRLVSLRQANDEIRSAIHRRAPYCLTRFGSVELAAIEHCTSIPAWTHLPVPGRITQNLSRLAGFFPPRRDAVYQFVKVYGLAARDFDAIAIRSAPKNWTTFEQESLVASRWCPNAAVLPIEVFNDPFQPENDWLSALEGLRVLVVHPFRDSIERNFNTRFDFLHQAIGLPRFHLQVYSPVVTNADQHEESPYRDWFAALEAMRQEILRLEFDVALIAAGAYGAFLAQAVKSDGRIGLHVGGPLQLLFAIAGQRWVDPSSIDFLPQTLEPGWERPLRTERPSRYQTVEGGCYW